MYKMIGADGREYGPISTEQLRQWLAEGRANAQTKVQAEGSTEWRTIAECPEFADVLHTAAAAATPPAGGPVNAEALAAQITATGYTLDIGSCIRRAWELLKANFWPAVGATLIVYLLLGGVGGVISGVTEAVIGRHERMAGVVSFGTSSLWNFVVGGALLGGLYLFFLKLIRGQPASIGDVFAGFSLAFGQLTAAYIVSTLLTYVGLIFCILPGIYLGVAWIYAVPLVIDKQLAFWDAMELSRKVVTKNWWSVFALVLLSGLVAASGLIACCIGVIATAPIGVAALMYGYEDIFRTAQPPST